MLGPEVSEVVGSFNQGRRRWYLLGKRMSPKCVVALLGLGNFRTNRLLHGRKDRRLRLWGGAHGLQLNMFHSESSKHDDDQCKLTFITILPCLLLLYLPPEGNHRCPKKRRSVDLFLLDLYIKAAGMLPQRCRTHTGPIAYVCFLSAKTLVEKDAFSALHVAGFSVELVLGREPSTNRPKKWWCIWMSQQGLKNLQACNFDNPKLNTMNSQATTNF